MAQTVIRAPESTENIPAARRVRDVVNRIAYLDPDASPLTVVLQKASNRVAVNPKFEWMEKDLPARFSQTTGTATSGATTVAVADPTYFSIGDIVNVIRTGEKVRVDPTYAGTSPLVIVRGVGSTAAAAINNGDDLQIIGNAYAEGAASGASKTHQELFPFNYSQIIRTPVSATGSEEASELYGGKTRPRYRVEKAVEHKIDLERTLLFGERNLDASATASPIRYSGGFLYYATSNVVDAGGILTEPEVENFAQQVFARTGGSDTRLLMASPLVISVIDQFAHGRMETVPAEKTFGVSITQWITSHGTFLIAKHRLLENGPGGTGFGGYALAAEVSNLVYRFLQDRNTKLRMDIQAPDLDAWKDEYLTEMGLQFVLPGLHGVLKGVTG